MDPNLKGMKAIIKLCEELKDVDTLQLVAFPQEGFYRYEGVERLMEKALKYYHVGKEIYIKRAQLEITQIALFVLYEVFFLLLIEMTAVMNDRMMNIPPANGFTSTESVSTIPAPITEPTATPK
jgi:ABC-type uncharacterized transport system YnjBCD permease subunit